jgi:hypothetical protein
MTDRDWIEVCLSGGEFDDAAHVELERQLTETPDSLDLRIRQISSGERPKLNLA